MGGGEKWWSAGGVLRTKGRMGDGVHNDLDDRTMCSQDCIPAMCSPLVDVHRGNIQLTCLFFVRGPIANFVYV